MKIAIYNTVSGQITRTVNCPPDHVDLQIEKDEEYFLNCPDSATHIVNNCPKTIASPNDTLSIENIRQKRNELLSACDWRMLNDAPGDKQAWTAYRQRLRDFPAICNLENPVWPEMPI